MKEKNHTMFFSSEEAARKEADRFALEKLHAGLYVKYHVRFATYNPEDGVVPPDSPVDMIDVWYAENGRGRHKLRRFRWSAPLEIGDVCIVRDRENDTGVLRIFNGVYNENEVPLFSDLDFEIADHWACYEKTGFNIINKTCTPLE